MTLHEIGTIAIAFGLGGLFAGSLAYHAGLTDGAKKMLDQITRQHRRASR